jgi:hypothetical protein
VTPIKPHIMATDSLIHRPKPLTATTDDHRRALERHLVKAAAVKNEPRLAGNASRLAAAAPASSASMRPSAAGSYSPLAPSQLGTDDYASIDIMARDAHADTTARRPQSASVTSVASVASANSSANNEPQWIDRLSHRRVTEVPDQFAR